MWVRVEVRVTVQRLVNPVSTKRYTSILTRTAKYSDSYSKLHAELSSQIEIKKKILTTILLNVFLQVTNEHVRKHVQRSSKDSRGFIVYVNVGENIVHGRNDKSWTPMVASSR